MAKVNNIILKGASGKIGGLIVRQTAHGTVLANAPRRPRKGKKLTEAQAEVRDRFSSASTYARTQLKDPTMAALYASGVTSKRTSAYAVAMTDYLTSPEVRSIWLCGYTGKPGETIRVFARDDFRVAAVSVSVINAAGKVIEAGEAVPQTKLNDFWEYQTCVENKGWRDCRVTVLVHDHAGNIASSTVHV